MGTEQPILPDSADARAQTLREETKIAEGFAALSTPAERRRAFGILFASLVGVGAGQTVLFAILPPVSRQLHLSAVQMTSIFAVSALLWVLSSTYWGQKSDVWGRRPIMLMGLIAFAISFGLLATVMGLGLRGWIPAVAVFPLMVASRAIYGIFGSGTFPSAQAYVADRTAPQERLSGVATINAAFGMGQMVGPGIATLFAAVALLAPFYFVSAVALASAGAIWFLLPEKAPPRLHAQLRASLKWHDRRIMPFVLFAVGLSVAGAIPLQTMGLFFIDMLHVKGQLAAQYNLIGQMASSMAALFAQLVVVQRFDFSARQLTGWGCVIVFTSFAIFLLAHNFGPLVFALTLFGLGVGVARPGFASAASLTVAPHEQGAVAGIIGAANATGWILGPLIGWMYDTSPYFPYAFGAATMIGLVIYMWSSATLRNAGASIHGMEVADQTPPSPGAEA